MQLLSESSFFQALAYSLIASIWQMGLLWLAAVIVLKSFSLSSAQKFNIAFGAQVSGFILLLYTCFNTYTTNAGKFIITEKADYMNTAETVINAIMPYAAALYLGILLYKLVKLSFVFDSTRRLKKNHLKKIAAAQRIFVQEYSQLFSIHRNVKIYLSEKVICPLTTGFLKPVILIPVAAINHLSVQQLEAVILHELAHIKRVDYLLYILQNFIEKIFFFNVFAGMLGEIIERERENACDDWVLQFRYSSMHYAEALFKLGRIKAMPAMAMPLLGKKENVLLLRIKRLLHNHKMQPVTLDFRQVLLGLFSLVMCTGFLVSLSPGLKNNYAAPPTNDVVRLNREPVAPAAGVSVMNAAEEEPVEALAENQADKAVASNNNKKQLKAKEQTRFDEMQVTTEPLSKEEAEPEAALGSNYVYNVSQSLDSLRLTLPEIKQAVAARVQLNTEQLQKAVSYQNFKQLETMLAATGDSISVKENNSTKSSYKKLITIEAFDKNGNKHTYSVVVELYQ